MAVRRPIRPRLAAGDGQTLVETIARNIYGGSPAEPAAAPRLAAYMREAVRDLKAQDSACLGGRQAALPGPSRDPCDHRIRA